MPQVTDPDRRDMIRSVVYISIYVFVIGVSAFYLLPNLWYLWMLLVVMGVLILVNWHKERTAYRCLNCEHIYEISFLTDLIAPHGVDREGAWLYLRCPNCRQRKKTKVLKKIE